MKENAAYTFACWRSAKVYRSILAAPPWSSVPVQSLVCKNVWNQIQIYIQSEHKFLPIISDSKVNHIEKYGQLVQGHLSGALIWSFDTTAELLPRPQAQLLGNLR